MYYHRISYINLLPDSAFIHTCIITASVTSTFCQTVLSSIHVLSPHQLHQPFARQCFHPYMYYHRISYINLLPDSAFIHTCIITASVTSTFCQTVLSSIHVLSLHQLHQPFARQCFHPYMYYHRISYINLLPDSAFIHTCIITASVTSTFCQTVLSSIHEIYYCMKCAEQK